MIFIDSSEYREGSTMPKVEGAIVVEGLESMTGADCMISGIDLPATKLALIQEHVAEKAILIQLKRSLDLAASVGLRLGESLIKMREIAPMQSQRVLLFVGTLGCDSDQRAIIDGRRVDDAVPGVNYWAVQSSLDAWSERGGVVVQLSRIGLLADWLTRKEERLKKYIAEPKAYFYPEKPSIVEEDLSQQSTGLQIPIKINDGRVSLAYTIGPKKAQLMWEACKGDIVMIFYHLSNPDDWPHLPKGVYPSDGQKFCDRMGLNGRIWRPYSPVSDDY